MTNSRFRQDWYGRQTKVESLDAEVKSVRAKVMLGFMRTSLRTKVSLAFLALGMLIVGFFDLTRFDLLTWLLFYGGALMIGPVLISAWAQYRAAARGEQEQWQETVAANIVNRSKR